MKHSVRSSLAAALFLAAPFPAAAQVDYEKDVKPILAQHCYACHGEEVQQSGLRLDKRQNALRGGDYGPVIVPGKSGASKLIRRVVDGDGAMQMPPTGPLAAEEIAILRAWIDQGAEFRNDVAEEPPPAPLDPKVAALIAAIRSQPAAAVKKLLGADLSLVKARDRAGSTPLHHAAAFGTLDAVALLLDAGADINAKNRRGATPLHWAIDDEAKVRLLLSRGAAVNSKQVEGRTPLFQAASLGQGQAILRLLLEHGADPSISTVNGQTPLMAAAARGDADAIRMLLDAKANVNVRNGAGETALMLAASDGNPGAVRLLLERGADARARTKRNETALGNAGTAGNEDTVRLLLEHAAEVNVRNIRGYSPLMLAASSDSIPAAAMKLLLANGADASFTADYEESALDLAAKRGETAVTQLLRGSRPIAARSPVVPLAARPRSAGSSIGEAAEKAFTPLEKQSYTFIRTGGCNSCHSQDLPSAASGYARSRGLQAPREIPQLPANMMPSPERIMDFGIVGVTSVAWELFDFGMNGVPKNAYSDAVVRVIEAMQTPAGNWSANESRRPPMSAGEYQAAALAIYALQRYAPTGHEERAAHAIARAAAWLEQSAPETTQDRAFQALGLAWAGRPERARAAARSLAAMQRADGGWNQLPLMESDAYATGQALFALKIAGGMAMADPAYRRGVEYLVRTQADDGTWHVQSRSIWLQPYFESGFPYGRDQFISTAGTAWAAMALAGAATPQTITARRASTRREQ